MNVKTELNEKRRIVANIVNNQRSKINNQKALDSYINMPHEMPNTKHASYLAMTKGETPLKESIEQAAGNNSSPFNSLKYY